MTTILNIPRNLALLSVRLAGLAAGLGLAVRGPATAAEAPDATKPETKPYTLFMGVDIEVQYQKDFYRAHAVHDSSLVVKVGDKDILVPMNRGPVNMKVDQELKLTESFATLQELKSERAYTRAADPLLKFQREQPGNAGAAAADLADNNAVANSAAYSSALSNPRVPAGQVAELGIAAGKANAAAVNARMQSDFDSPAYYAGKMASELARQEFNAMEVTFQASSPKPLTSPYVVIVAQYREKDEKPGAAHNWIYAQELPAIGPEPRKVHILQGGLPPGFELLKLQLHLYNRGRELATNVADKQVALTRDEAVQYLLIDYLGSHKGATLPATPALGRLTPEARARLAEGQYRQPFFVKVSKDGVPLAAFVNEACSQKIEDTFAESLILEVRFNPALEKGRPVEGVAQLKFSELAF